MYMLKTVEEKKNNENRRSERGNSEIKTESGKGKYIYKKMIILCIYIYIP